MFNFQVAQLFVGEKRGLVKREGYERELKGIRGGKWEGNGVYEDIRKKGES